MTTITKDDEWLKTKPVVRGVLALLFRLRFAVWDDAACYKEADKFVKQFEKDYDASHAH